MLEVSGVSGPNLVGVELIVAQIDAALALFVDALGLELVERRASTDPVGEIALVAAGDAVITLLAPADKGPGFVLSDREPRLSQIVLATPSAGVAELASRVTEAGVPVQTTSETSFFVTPSGCKGALGAKTAVVVTAVADSVR